jgi:hypothetical protein
MINIWKIIIYFKEWRDSIEPYSEENGIQSKKLNYYFYLT